jgi:hypothetical protein
MRAIIQVSVLTTVAIMIVFSPTFFPTTAPMPVQSKIASNAEDRPETFPIVPSAVIEANPSFFLRTGDGN